MGELPIDHEDLRPLLRAMQRVAERHGSGVVAFDKRNLTPNADLTLDDRFWLGLIVPVAAADPAKVEVERECPGAQVLVEPYPDNQPKRCCTAPNGR